MSARAAAIALALLAGVAVGWSGAGAARVMGPTPPRAAPPPAIARPPVDRAAETPGARASGLPAAGREAPGGPTASAPAGRFAPGAEGPLPSGRGDALLDALALFPAPERPTGTARLAGLVRLEDGSPLAGALVLVEVLRLARDDEPGRRLGPEREPSPDPALEAALRRIDRRRAASAHRWIARTDAAGRYALEGLPAGEFDVGLPETRRVALDGDRSRTRVELPRDREADLVGYSVGHVLVRVLDAEGRLLHGEYPEIRVRSLDGEPVAGRLWWPGDPRLALRPGSYEVTALLAGRDGEFEWIPVVVAPGATAEVTLVRSPVLEAEEAAGEPGAEPVEEAAPAEPETPWDPLESTCRHASLSIL